MLHLIYASSAYLVQCSTALQVIHYHVFIYLSTYLIYLFIFIMCVLKMSHSQTLGKFPGVTEVLNNPAEMWLRLIYVCFTVCMT